MISVPVKVCKNEALNKLYFKSFISAFKKGENIQVTRKTIIIIIYPYTAVLEVNMRLMVYEMVLFNHRYLDVNNINLKTFVFLAIY